MKLETKGRFSFRGGVHPPESKSLTDEIPIQPGPAVKEVGIMLSQHIGAVCQPLVRKGNMVQAGQKIGDSDAFVSAPVHSPITGKVKEIALRSHAIIGRSKAIIIEAYDYNPTKRSYCKIDDDFDENNYSAEKICDSVRQAGIVGMGGAGFPTRVKIEPNPRLPKDTLIINGCECEPYITCDYRLMLEYTRQIIAGVKLARKASGCSRTFICIEDNKPKAIEAMNEAVESFGGGIQVVPIKTKYPQGGERQLISALLKRYVPTGGIPPMIGVVVLNVATAAAIAEAVVADLPLTHRVVTVTGEGVARPGNFYVPIGTSVAELIQFSGGLKEDAVRVILGGPMMGIAIADLTKPITKTVGAIIALTEKQIGGAKFAGRQTPCLRCGRCLEVCPENLNPTKIAHAVKHNLLDVAENNYINACIECGSCSYVCPANIEVSGHIRTGKMLLARQKKKIPD
ncbi:MAG: electron transport complex subunit RsxC [Phycisphaerae bacterium]|nr:electron transport complex subunit RsxC [Phycisphaerae bacterium]NIP55156.1 electron transport complex subunit RsxC [Phycisphaerae bacterium]NIS53568.1 electron transport complex subunit RsxC [Phycisphaerae bacterium]NIU11460.1 electron transport complex subunit RsxC [Phycisphaerae bacterium]NIU55541.1 electron transport complex subunit RsxC [Phycisphaerae bacterium]